MCNLDHPIQTVALTCPDSVAIVGTTEDGRREVFYSLPAMVDSKVGLVMEGLAAAAEADDELKGAYLVGVGDFLTALLESNDILLGVEEGSRAFGINDISDMWPE